MSKFARDTRFFAKLVGAKLLNKRFPLTAIFNVLNRCNMKCKHCYANYYSRGDVNTFSTEQGKQIIKDLHENGCERLSFAGGEPLLRKDVFELLDYARSLDISTVLNTNGTLIPRFLPELAKLDGLAVSIDGRPEHHDLVRGPGTAAQTLKGIEAAVNYGIPVVTNTVINKKNLGDIDYILDIARKYKIKAEFALYISNVFGNDMFDDEHKPTDEEYRTALKLIIQRKKEGAPILFSQTAYEGVLYSWKDFNFEGGANGTPQPEGMPTCPAARFFCLIDADGTLWACPHLIGKIDSKNILETSVKEAWKTAEQHTCKGCYQVYHHEFAHLMKLEPQVIWNYVKPNGGH